MNATANSPRRLARWIASLLILGLVCWAVRGTARTALNELARHEWRLSIGWAIASGALYLAGLFPMAWFWRRTLSAMGLQTDWLHLALAYYLGHLGKYVPGKAMVVVLRAGMLTGKDTPLGPVVVSVFLETLTMMAVGGFLAAALALAFLHLKGLYLALALAMMVVAGVPTLPPVARRLAKWSVMRSSSTERETRRQGDTGKSSGGVPPGLPISLSLPLNSLDGITYKLAAMGWAAGILCWIALGLSLWAALRAAGVTSLEPVRDLPLLVASVSLSMVAGFLSLLPGGIVVRDALLMELLSTRCEASQALVAAVLLRLIWLVSEVGICVILYLWGRFAPQDAQAA